ncbi:MAG: hypothetical protein U0Q19_19510 [Kineosporiaceae bacterium]
MPGTAGRPRPPGLVVFCAPLKKVLLSMLLGVGSSACVANSPIQVVPTIAASGVLPAVIAVANLSWAESHGMAVTCTVTPGLAASNCLASAGSFSPSVPIAQTVIVPVALPELTAPAVPVEVPAESADRPQAARANVAPRPSATAVVRRECRFMVILPGRAEPGDGAVGAGTR